MSCKPDFKRPSWRQSEKDIIEKLNKERNLKFETQVSFKEGEKGVGGLGSSRLDGFDPGPPPVSIEIKNYDQHGYQNGRNFTTKNGKKVEIPSMVDTLKKQFEERELNLPEGTKQEVHIDIRGQNINDDLLKEVQLNLEDIGYEVVEFH